MNPYAPHEVSLSALLGRPAPPEPFPTLREMPRCAVCGAMLFTGRELVDFAVTREPRCEEHLLPGGKAPEAEWE